MIIPIRSLKSPCKTPRSKLLLMPGWAFCSEFAFLINYEQWRIFVADDSIDRVRVPCVCIDTRDLLKQDSRSVRERTRDWTTSHIANTTGRFLVFLKMLPKPQEWIPSNCSGICCSQVSKRVSYRWARKIEGCLTCFQDLSDARWYRKDRVCLLSTRDSRIFFSVAYFIETVLLEVPMVQRMCSWERHLGTLTGWNVRDWFFPA